MCIFVDGLDEVCPRDGPSKPLQTLEDIGSFPGVKLCVSSRPDEPFRQGLATASSLQLHTLTAPDIYRFAVAQLKAQLESLSIPPKQETAENLAHKIVDKSGDVFL